MTEYKIKQDSNVPHLMLEIWESRIPTNSPVGLTLKRKASLQLLFTHVFGSSLSRWEAFVDLIAISEPLILKAVKACDSGKSGEFLNWAIKPEICSTILAGVYTDASDKLGDSLGNGLGNELGYAIDDELEEDSADTEETQAAMNTYMTDMTNQDTSKQTSCRLAKLESLAARLRENTNRLDQLRKALWIVDNSQAFNEWYESKYK